MARIRRLPLEVAQKIAAGEVIERPVSVVKELVENSLDAGAAEVRVELQAGGKKLVRVQDDGAGMSREDAGLCFERHATSKIAGEEDLEKLATLGFRGEALASISAVAKVVLKTSDGQADRGVRVERRAGELLSVSEVAFPRGTSVEVEEIFFNLPARRKFLRSDQSELSLIVRYLTAVALAFPEVSFFLGHSRREIINCPRVNSHRERIFQLYGKAALENLMEVSFREGESYVFGYASRPPAGRTDKSRQSFFINKRPVKDRVLQAALSQAFRGFLEKDTYPEAFLFLTLPYENVDVNVHPTKAEVRFRDSQLVFYLVLKGIERAMLAAGGLKEIYPAAKESGAEKRVGESFSARFSERFARPLGSDQTLFPLGLKQEGEKAPVRVLGPYLGTYIVAADEAGLLVIDQHNAHERVLFEKYKEIDARRKWPQVAPLVPCLVELTPGQVVAFEANRALLEEAGFSVEPMGGKTYSLAGFPDIFGALEAKDVFLALLEEMEEGEPGRKRERLLATLACKTAVKAGEILPPEKMEYLVEELFRTSNPSLCPHGRPIIVKIDRAEIERGLKR